MRTLFVLFFLIFGPLSASDKLAPIGELDSKNFDPVTFEKAIRFWVDQMVEVYLEGEGLKETEMPPSFKRTSANDKIKNSRFARWLSKEMPEVINLHIEDPVNQSMQDVRLDMTDKIQRLDKSRFNGKKGPLFDYFKESISNPNSFDRILFADDNPLDHEKQEFLARIERDKKRYGEEFYSDMTVAKGVVDVIGTSVHPLMMNKKIHNREALFAIGMLHPITDSVVDSGNFDKDAFLRILQYLEGAEVDPVTRFENLVFDYVDSIYSAFNGKDLEFVKWLLPFLFKEQMKSAIDKPSTKKEILRSAFLRGGLSSLAFVIPSIGKFDAFQTWGYFVGGGIYQLLDDFTDILADRQEGIPTIWLLDEKENKSFDKSMSAFMHLEKTFEVLSTDYASTSEHDVARYIHVRGFQNILMMSIILNGVDPKVAALEKKLAPFFPVHFALPKRLIEGIYNLGKESIRDTSHLTSDGGFNQWIEVGLFNFVNGGDNTKHLDMNFSESAARLLHDPTTLWGKVSRVIGATFNWGIKATDKSFDFIGAFLPNGAFDPEMRKENGKMVALLMLSALVGEKAFDGMGPEFAVGGIVLYSVHVMVRASYMLLSSRYMRNIPRKKRANGFQTLEGGEEAPSSKSSLQLPSTWPKAKAKAMVPILAVNNCLNKFTPKKKD